MILILLLILLLNTPVFTVPPHISGKIFPQQPKFDYSEKFGSLKFSPQVAYKSITGSKKIAVIIVDFRDQKFTTGWQQNVIESVERFKMYYTEVSDNKISFDITYFYSNGSSNTLTGSEIPYRMPRNMSYYAQNTLLTLSQLVRDALISATGKVTKNSFDYVMVLHAGYGAESMPDPTGYIWSAYVFWTGSVYGFTDGTIIPEKEYNASFVGVLCHEFGHQIGLPDLYYQQQSVVGSWCLMDGGLWSGQPAGYTPTHLSCWAKKFLGWVDVEIISSTIKNFSLKDVKEEKKVVKIPILEADDPETEYFLLEYRKKVNFDSYLKGEGLLVWHIDDSIASSQVRLSANDINSGEPHLGVDLIEADKTPASNGGDAGDPFPGATQQTLFKPSLWNVYAYNNAEIKMSILNITNQQDNITFDVIFGEVQPSTDVYYNLYVSVEPQNYGNVSISSGSFLDGTTIQIFASPNDGYEFDKWTGDIMSFENPILIIMDSDKNITAVFKEKQVEITIDTTAPSAITDLFAQQVSSDSVLLTWTSTGDDGYNGDVRNGKYIICFSTYFNSLNKFLENAYRIEFSTNVFANTKQSYVISSLLNDTTYYFGIFLVDDSSNTSDVSNISSVYLKKYEYREEKIYCEINISIQPPGSGQVVIEPMNKVFLKGTTVVLYADAYIGYEFSNWSGDIISNKNPLQIVITTNTNITANFVKIQEIVSDTTTTTTVFDYNKKIYVVSKNNDNINDKIFFNEDIEEIKLFSPKQKLVIEKKAPFVFDGKELPTGLYIFEIKLKNGVKKHGVIVVIKE